MPAYERSAVMARGYPGFGRDWWQVVFEEMKKIQKKIEQKGFWLKNRQILDSDHCVEAPMRDDRTAGQ